MTFTAMSLLISGRGFRLRAHVHHEWLHFLAGGGSCDVSIWIMFRGVTRKVSALATRGGMETVD